jgi:hypothetical protein
MNVRSAITTMLALAALALGIGVTPATASGGAGGPRVTIAVLPQGTGLERLHAALPDAALGLLSPGLGDVPARQSYLDITQGNRVSESLYPDSLPPLHVSGGEVPPQAWAKVLDRADGAPAEIFPGLLAELLGGAGIPIGAEPDAGPAGLMAVSPDGRIGRAGCRAGQCPGVTVTAAEPSELAGLAERVDPARGDLLIAIEGPPAERKLLAIAVAGDGFDGGELTSATTRMDGYVVSTDLLPTILGRYGVDFPDEKVTGRAIESTGGELDVAALADRENRLSEIQDRRWGVLAVNLLLWAAAAALACAAGRRRGARIALPMLAVTMAAAPLLLLLTAWLEPSEVAERLIVGLGAPLLAALALVLAGRSGRGPYAAFAAVAGLTVGATALDVIAGSPLTALSLLGPNPALGVRFFGIGNELEATIAVLLLLGTGAGVAAARAGAPREGGEGRTMAIATIVVTVLAVLVFAPGRLGADVGAAITFPAGAAVAVIVALRLNRRQALLVLAAPVAALAALVLIDLVSGGDAHLSRSVLGAGGLHDLGDVFDRRVRQSLRSFPRYLDSPFLYATLAGVVLGVVYRRRIAGWLDGSGAARAGVAGAVAATIVGTAANDSGALLLMVGTGFIAAFCGLAWAQRDPENRLADGRPPR